MMSQIERLQILLDKIMMDRYPQIKNIKVMEGPDSTIHVRVNLVQGFEGTINEIENEIRKISKMVSIPLKDVSSKLSSI